MKLKCNRQSFCEAVAVVLRAVSPRSSLPALEGVLVRARSGGVDLFGYDLDTGISTHIDAAVEEPGEIVLTAKVLLDIVKRMPGDTVSLSVGERSLTELRSGMAEYTILGIPADEFPEFPQVAEPTALSLAQNVLKSMIEQTLFAVSQSDAKPVHTGSLFEVAQGNVTVVSVDSYRLALRKEQAKTDRDIKFIVPGKTLSEISRILADSDEAAEILVSKKHIIFNIGSFSVYSRLLEGDFLDYRAAIPKSHNTTVRVAVREFVDSIERTSLLISDRIKSPLRVSFQKEMILLACSTSLGKASDQTGAKLDGETLEMGFNNRYLLDALRASGCDEVLLEISGALSPMKIVPPEGDQFLFLVLPVRLKNE